MLVTDVANVLDTSVANVLNTSVAVVLATAASHRDDKTCHTEGEGHLEVL